MSDYMARIALASPIVQPDPDNMPPAFFRRCPPPRDHITVGLAVNLISWPLFPRQGVWQCAVAMWERRSGRQILLAHWTVAEHAQARDAALLILAGRGDENHTADEAGGMARHWFRLLTEDELEQALAADRTNRRTGHAR